MIDEYPAGGVMRSGAGGVLVGQGAQRPAVASATPRLAGDPATDAAHRSNTPSDEVVRNELILIEKILAGESELFMELVRPYQKLVYSMAVSIMKSEHDAEDVSQESLFKAFKNLSQFRGECKFSTWVIQITLNEARHRIRKRQRAAEDSMECGFENEEGDYMPIDLADWREIPSEALQRKELRDALHQAISDLKPIYRDVLVLRDVDHLSVAETAQLLKISEASVKTRLLRARLQVRDALAPGFDGYWNTGGATYKRVRPF
jgi:RNA polymerase sigma-70 factor (ECF subfamily)